MIDLCGCYDPQKISYFDGAPPCNRSVRTLCGSEVQHFQWNSDYLDNVCYPLCPLECASTEYKTSTSLNQYPTNSYANVLAKRNQITLYSTDTYSEPLKENCLKVNIYFEALSYTSTSEVASIDQITFISNVGGLFGLFLGATVLSFLEIIEFFIIVIHIVKSRLLKVATCPTMRDTRLINVRHVENDELSKQR
jgi:hypothetical protein